MILLDLENIHYDELYSFSYMKYVPKHQRIINMKIFSNK